MSIHDIVGRRLNLSDRMLVVEALKRGASIEKVSEDLFYLKNGRKKYRVTRGKVIRSYNALFARKAIIYKEVTSRLLRNSGISTPENVVFSSNDMERAWNWAKPILPVVLKPHNGGKGELVFVKITTYEDFKSSFNKVAEKNREVLIEEFVEGKEYRFLYVNSEIVAVAHRIPANVVGDGTSTVEELVELKNNERKSNPVHRQPLNFDKESLRVLKRQNVSKEDIPENGKRIYLRENSNISTGGDTIDVTDEISDDIKNKVAEVGRAIPGLRVSGIDVIVDGDKINVLELNSHPMLSIHHYPWEGAVRDVVGKVADGMFPELVK